MSDAEIISLQVGNYCNEVGAHAWNLRDRLSAQDDTVSNPSVFHHVDDNYKTFPRTVIVDLFENTSNYSEEPVSQSLDVSLWSGTVSRAISDATTEHGWLDVLKPELHQKSLVQLPKWADAVNFDSFYKGQVSRHNDVISDLVLEDILDRLRYFAEGCNRVSAVQVWADLQLGFGGLACSILEGVVEDFGAVCLPVFAFCESGSSVRENNIANRVRELNIPLAYNGLMEHASVFVPLEASRAIDALLQPGLNSSNTALATAVSLQAATLFDVRSGKRAADIHGVREWTSDVSQGGRFPLCCLEAYFTEKHCRRSGTEDELASIQRTMRANVGRPNLNLFTTSLSAVNHGPWAVRSRGTHYSTPFTNVVHFVGDYHVDIGRMLVAQCGDIFKFSKFDNCRTPQFLSFVEHAALFQTVDESTNEFLRPVSAIAAVGASKAVGEHLEGIASTWNDEADVCKVQLTKFGVTGEDAEEIGEQFLQKSSAY